ncbi:amidophosphoribosyltransferase [Ignatzschineria sp. RMDPL8A]|uniref:amidophosphoribosyltransferase n=1 Tax=Ignatzschineria sp. RMDPL8A TaxID=2999236 RepID=UPI0024465E93|nr:amidophosphoribosyltransferase [Ignatzschineria sp. RMDPL8A]MDG9730282.1 amidophosphoribosyltransferase [Ignatzschineria sp. RMDPL8A]
MFDRGLNEECGVFAVIGNERAASLTYYGLHALQHRGQESAGITVLSDDNKFLTHKGEGLVTEVFEDRRHLKKLIGSHAIGHVRYPVTGAEGPANVQPINLTATTEKISIAYNGALINAEQIKTTLESEGSIFHASGDAEIIGHILRRKKGSFVDRLKESLLEIDGAFCYVLLHDSGVYVARDRYGIRPLSIGKLSDGGYVFSSETCALNIVGATFLRDVEPGEVVYVENGKLVSEFYTDETTHAMCMMEYIYFSRPDSDIVERNVHSVRKRSGIELFKETHVDADIVIGVPDSSISAANGYAEAAKLPNEMGLIKNRYIGRTFIAPNQAMREQGVRMKISAIPSIVKDKRVILIDDSIVRGTTSKRIVSLLREAGAKEIHMRISSPPIKYPCFYGVDTTVIDDLMAHQLSIEEMRRHIGADTLAFLSDEGMIKSVGLDESYGDNCGHCMACFTGKYPTKLYDAVEDANH